MNKNNIGYFRHFQNFISEAFYCHENYNFGLNNSLTSIPCMPFHLDHFKSEFFTENKRIMMQKERQRNCKPKTDFFSPTPEDMSPTKDDEKNDDKNCSLYRKAILMKPHDNIGLDFFHKQ